MTNWTEHRIAEKAGLLSRFVGEIWKNDPQTVDLGRNIGYNVYG